MTEWRPISGWPYEVSDAGAVRNIRTGRILKQQLHKSGYINVQLWRHQAFWTIGVHQLIALAFIGPVPSNHEVRHLDGDRTHNVRSNLCYGLHVDNMQDRDAHGTTARGERNGKIKHSDSVVETARSLRHTGLSYAKIGASLGVHHSTVFGWLSGRRR